MIIIIVCNVHRVRYMRRQNFSTCHRQLSTKDAFAKPMGPFTTQHGPMYSGHWICFCTALISLTNCLNLLHWAAARKLNTSLESTVVAGSMSNQRIPRQAKAVRILNEQMVLNVLAFNYNPHTDAIILKFSESPLAFLTRPTSRYERHVSQHGDVFVTLALL